MWYGSKIYDHIAHGPILAVAYAHNLTSAIMNNTISCLVAVISTRTAAGHLPTLVSGHSPAATVRMFHGDPIYGPTSVRQIIIQASNHPMNLLICL